MQKVKKKKKKFQYNQQRNHMPEGYQLTVSTVKLQPTHFLCSTSRHVLCICLQSLQNLHNDIKLIKQFQFITNSFH